MSFHKIQVVAAVIEKDGKLLICQRKAEKRHGSLWEFPGGKCEEGESFADAVKRELFEELGLKSCDVGNVLYSAIDPNSNFVINFINTSIEGEPIALDHEKIAWVALNELKNYQLAPSDSEFVKNKWL